MNAWSFQEARAKCAAASSAQIACEKQMRDASQSFAEKEESYRVALAKAIVRAHDEDGKAWSVCPDLARGDENVARLRRNRDIAEGVREATTQAAWRAAADRKDAQRFADWSQRREFADGGGPVEVVGPLERVA